MSVKRSRPGNPKVRSGKKVGSDYPEDRFTNPFNAGIDKEFGEEKGKRLYGPTETTPGGAGVPTENDYDKYWDPVKEGKR